ncbi:MAG: hypothetical protein R8M38_01405 [Mariprofundaceae bacterium]
MALTVHGADGFINRLLQQNSRAHAQADTADAKRVAGGEDQVSISSEARQAKVDQPNSTLESQLLKMYDQRGSRS